MQPDILERYKKFQDRFDLPHLQELRDVFTFEIDDSDKIIDHIRMEISDRIFSLSEKVIEPIIGGAETFSCLFEQDMITERDRERLFHLYKKVQVLKWENNLLAVRSDEKANAQWIKRAWDFWNRELASELATICRQMALGWTDMTFKQEKTIYHG